MIFLLRGSLGASVKRGDVILGVLNYLGMCYHCNQLLY